MACLNYNLFIGLNDTMNAFGNFTYSNGVVYAFFTDCNGYQQSEQFISGTWNNAFCADNSYPITLTYYQNNSPFPAVNSSYVPASLCGPSTPTPTPTPTTTKTPTPTPTKTSIICGSGVTTGNYYYTDCCGNLISGTDVGTIVTLNYSKPFNGVNKLNQPFTTACITPTPTQTPTQTNTPVYSSTPTPTLTKTPTPTPTLTRTPSVSTVYKLKNSCDVFTLFDMGVICNPIRQPSSQDSYDGILSVQVTGGTSPYSFFWEGGQRSQTVSGLKAGFYEVIVVDYYSDYTVSAICSLLAPSPTPTPTTTSTPTPTPPLECKSLCLYAVDLNTSIGPLQFECNGLYNEKLSWFNGDYYIVWKPTQNRWEVVGSDKTTAVVFGPGVMVSTSTSQIPLSSWNFVGGTGTPPPITVVQGTCPSTLPLMASITSSNNNCSGVQNCDGSISFTAKYGTPPYTYSINNGSTFQSGSIFNGLCPGTYTTIVKDSINNTYNQTVVLNANSTNTTYTISVVSKGSNTNSNTNTANRLSNFEIVVSPPLPNGTTINFNLNIETLIKNMGPWFTNEPNLTATYNYIPQLFKNNVDITSQLTTQVPAVTLGNRPNCSPSQMATIDSGYNVNLTMTAGDVVTGSIYCELTETNPVIQNSCVSTITSEINVSVSNSIISGCYCCDLVTNTVPAKYNLEVIGKTVTVTPPLLGLYLASNRADACSQTNGFLIPNVAFTYNGSPTYCNYTTLNGSPLIPSLSVGVWWVSDGVNVRGWTKADYSSALFNPSLCDDCS